MTKRLTTRIWTILLVASLGACGDANVEGPTIVTPAFRPPQVTAPAPATIFSVGPLSTLPDVTVNGVTYDTAGANVTVNGVVATLQDLEIGHIVTVNGTVNAGGVAGSANSVEFDANVVGPVDGIDASQRRIVVMGQSILLDADTTFDPRIDRLSLAGLSADVVVQISGLPAGNGDITATRVELSSAGSKYQVIGTVSGLDIGNLSFGINGLTVDYSSALVIDLPGGMPRNTMDIVVRGSIAADGRFIVEQMESGARDSGLAAGTRVAVAGYITNYRSDTDFVVSGFPVTTEVLTIFSHGMRQDLAPGAKVEVEGRRTAGGVIIADRIGFGSLTWR